MSEPQEIGCKQCELLLSENGRLKRGREIQRLKIKEMAQELQRYEERLQEEVNYSAKLAETIKEIQEK